MAINNTLKDIREERNLIQADLVPAARLLAASNVENVIPLLRLQSGWHIT
jgi:hypothetical protein